MINVGKTARSSRAWRSSEIDSRFFEKPYYVIPDGDEAEEGYAVIREALRQPRASPLRLTGKRPPRDEVPSPEFHSA